MILRRETVAALAFWLLVAGLVWLRVEIGPLDARPPTAGEPYATSSLRMFPDAKGSRISVFPDGR